MKFLSERQAASCEGATHPRCRCRCGGAMHGIARGTGREFFVGLPADDPHHLPTDDEKLERRYKKFSRGWNKARQLKLPIES